MSKMFYNYDNDIDIILPPVELPNLKPIQSSTGISILYNLKGEMYGVEAKHGLPFTLYFHLDELHGWQLDDLMASSMIEFKLITQNHKVALEKTFAGSDIFTRSQDLIITINQEEAAQLKQESYKMDLKLVSTTSTTSYFYPLFSESDGLLVIR